MLAKPIVAPAALAALVALGPALAAAQDEPDPKALVAAVEARETGETQTNKMTMILRDAGGSRRERQMEQLYRETDSAERSLLRFLAPADVAGTAFLTIDRSAGSDEQFLYLPDLGSTRRIAGSNQSEPFMGSDFSYADLGGRTVNEWTYELLDQEEVRGHKVWRVIATPKSEDVRQEYGYARSLLYIRPDIDMVVRAIHETTDGKRKYLDVRDIRKVDGIRVAHELEMRTAEDGSVVHATLLKLSDVAINPGLADGAVSQRALQRGG